MAELIQVHGLRELGAAFKLLSDDLQGKVARAATNAGAQVIKRRAIANVKSSPSVVTGSLAASVIVKKVPKSRTELTSEHMVTVRGRGKVSKKTGAKQSEAPHANLVEFGTVKAPAEPFLRPAIDAGKEEAIEAVRKRLEARIKKASK
jgi:HK97 gp10 family phage protein